MILREVIKGIKFKNIYGSLDKEILGITSDSNEVQEGFLFSAIKGDRTDGHKYIDSAIKKGAKIIILENIPEKIHRDICYIEVDDSRSITPKIASNFFQNPSRDLNLVGVTGTNGKTTLTYIIEAIWKEEGKPSGIIGTVENRYLNKLTNSSITTPDSIDLIKLLDTMKKSGVKNVSMEVSSHAIDKKRINGCNFDVVVFTNLTQDHLDYHKTIENYFNTKKKLFTEILDESSKTPKFSVINIDDKFGKQLAGETKGQVVTYSTKYKKADVLADKINTTESGVRTYIKTRWGNLELNSNLLGEHNLYNLLAAIAVTLPLGTPIKTIEKALSKTIVIPGRLEKIENNMNLNVLVDYAHTPDALMNVINAIRPFTKGKLIVVFGCGGDRDKQKRPLMGKVGINLSDFLIVTSDNPRTESPEKIIDDIVKGINESGLHNKNYIKILDRERAIEKAISLAQPGDFIIIAGKGHEDYQIIGQKKFPFDDRKVARKILNKKSHYTQ